MQKRAELNITVSPKSSRSTIKIDEENNIKVYLNSPPIDNKANNECIKLFSKKLHIAKSKIKIDKGEKSKKKKLIIFGFSNAEILEKLK